jgi:lysophospholipase L1-like esterase
MLTGGQLDEALSYDPGDVAFVTIDIGANDLLAHLGSSDCSDDITAQACTDRIDLSLEAYARNIDEIFAALRDRYPDATIVFLETYNPFSLGFEGEVDFERLSNQAVEELNQTAAQAAARYDIEVADGFTPMRGTTSATTHMTGISPDIHPNELGYDVLTEAVLTAFGQSPE